MIHLEAVDVTKAKIQQSFFSLKNGRSESSMFEVSFFINAKISSSLKIKKLNSLHTNQTEWKINV
jgi:hypothetical protein